MKKLFYSLMFMGMVSAVFAQQGSQLPEETKALKHINIASDAKETVPESRPAPNLRGGAIWESDFSDPSVWTTFYGENHTPPTIVWDIIDDNTVSPVGALNPMNLPSYENGFAFIDADPAGDGSVQDAFIHTVDPVDLTGVDNVALEFYQVSRNFATTYFVVYSLDGEEWTSVQVNTGLSGNTNTANPEYAIVDLTAQIADQPQVWIGFRYSANWGWFWAVDDVALVQSPDNYIAMRNGYYDKHATINNPDVFDELFGNDIDYVKSYEYSAYKRDQVRPLSFTADVENRGATPQTNVTFNVTVTDPDGAPHNYSETIETLAVGERVFIVIEDVELPPFHLGDPGTSAMVGTYTVSFSVEQDEEEFFPDDNVVADKTFRVHEEYMDHIRASLSYAPGWQGSDYAAITRFGFQETADIEYIQFALTTGDVDPSVALFESVNLNVGTGSIFANQPPPNDGGIAEIFGANGENLLFEDGSVSFFITDTDVFNSAPLATSEVTWVTVFFPEAITVDPEVIYNGIVEVGSPPDAPGVEGGFIWTMLGTGSNSASLFSGTIDGDAANFFIGNNVFAIRLGSADTESATAGEAPLTFTLGQNFPNPFDGTETLIEWELFEPAQNITFTVHDMNGRVVDQRKMGDRPAGKQETIRLNSNLAAGVYQYSLIIGNHRAVRKMVVAK